MKALVLLNGEPPSSELLIEKAANSEFIVCADGAAEWAYPIVKIDALVGDMDSMDSNHPIFGSCKEIVRLPCEKDETDAQVAVLLCAQRGADEICILGALGKRLDHALGNVQLLVLLHKMNINAVIEDDVNAVFCVNGTKHFFGKRGDLLSIIPLGENVRATTKNLKYPLNSYNLQLEKPLGISNVFLSENAQVETEGYSIIVLPK